MNPSEHLQRQALAEELRRAVRSDQPRPEEYLDLNVLTREQRDALDCACVLPTPAVARYLASGDPLTHHSINKMELALEEHYHVASPFYITSTRAGSEENSDLRVEYFTLMREADEDEKKG